jgi:hypothetical protein
MRRRMYKGVLIVWGDLGRGARGRCENPARRVLRPRVSFEQVHHQPRRRPRVVAHTRDEAFKRAEDIIDARGSPDSAG